MSRCRRSSSRKRPQRKAESKGPLKHVHRIPRERSAAQRSASARASPATDRAPAPSHRRQSYKRNAGVELRNPTVWRPQIASPKRWTWTKPIGERPRTARGNPPPWQKGSQGEAGTTAQQSAPGTARQPTAAANSPRPKADAGAPDLAREPDAGAPKGQAAGQPGQPKAAPITTPLPKDAKVGPDGVATVKIRDVTVRFLPDKRQDQPRDGTTSATPPARIPGYESENGRIKKLDGPLPDRTVEIQTTYARRIDDPAKWDSAYGRGTRPGDKDHSLLYHEQGHGIHALEFIRNNPMPPLNGNVGASAKQYDTQAAALAKWNAGLQRAVSREDPTGKKPPREHR